MQRHYSSDCIICHYETGAQPYLKTTTKKHKINSILPVCYDVLLGYRKSLITRLRKALVLVGTLVVPHEKNRFLNFPRPCGSLWTGMRTVCTRSASRDERRGSRALTDSCCLASTITKIICQSISPDWSPLFLFNQYLSSLLFSSQFSLCSSPQVRLFGSGPVQLVLAKYKNTEIGVQKKILLYKSHIYIL